MTRILLVIQAIWYETCYFEALACLVAADLLLWIWV